MCRILFPSNCVESLACPVPAPQTSQFVWSSFCTVSQYSQVWECRREPQYETARRQIWFLSSLCFWPQRLGPPPQPSLPGESSVTRTWRMRRGCELRGSSCSGSHHSSLLPSPPWTSAPASSLSNSESWRAQGSPRSHGSAPVQRRSSRPPVLGGT